MSAALRSGQNFRRHRLLQVPVIPPVVNLYKLHFGEEPVISGINAARGSGTVFFEGCGTGCVFCQNYDISHRLTGRGTKDGRAYAV